jgi:hypothetical protein
LWVADFTCVPTWSGMVCVAFVIDVYSRRILGWRAATSMKTVLVLDALEMAIWTRGRHGATDLAGLINQHDASSQYTCVAFTERLAAAGVDASAGAAQMVASLDHLWPKATLGQNPETQPAGENPGADRALIRRRLRAKPECGRVHWSGSRRWSDPHEPRQPRCVRLPIVPGVEAVGMVDAAPSNELQPRSAGRRMSLPAL